MPRPAALLPYRSRRSAVSLLPTALSPLSPLPLSTDFLPLRLRSPLSRRPSSLFVSGRPRLSALSPHPTSLSPLPTAVCSAPTLPSPSPVAGPLRLHFPLPSPDCRLLHRRSEADREQGQHPRVRSPPATSSPAPLLSRTGPAPAGPRVRSPTATSSLLPRRDREQGQQAVSGRRKREQPIPAPTADCLSLSLSGSRLPLHLSQRLFHLRERLSCRRKRPPLRSKPPSPESPLSMPSFHRLGAAAISIGF